MRIGAFDFIEKPISSPDALRRLVARALNWRSEPAPARVVETTIAEPAPVITKGPLAAVGAFLWQLKRRFVYNVAATYAAVGFITLQAVELILPVLPVPGWFYPALVGVVIAGFPVALAAAWVYDVTSNGVVRGSATEGAS